MPHNESQSVSRMKENFTSGLTGRGWKPTYDLVNKSLRNRKSGATGYQIYEARHQSFTLLAVLAEILAQAIQQLAQLKAILQNGSDTLGLLQDINRGINDSLGLMRTISPYVSPGVYGDLKKVEDVLRKFSDIYGIVVSSPDAKAQASVDQSVAEAVTMNSSIHDYTQQIDQIGEDIKSFSHSVSPGGAQKLTAESLGVVIHVLTQSLRAQGTLLKLQAQSIAITNKHEKDSSAQYLSAAGALSSVMQKNNSQFERPRF